MSTAVGLSLARVLNCSHMQQAQKRLFSAQRRERQQSNVAGLTFSARVRPTRRRTP
ncbi:unnamed protein product [Ectocarpus sp. CCAP 1310/34]|nr:unnamed protein product [Ectocarpus sp. CCAP 1310/34]